MALRKAANSGHHPALPASDLAADSARVAQQVVAEAEDVAKQAAEQQPPVAQPVDSTRLAPDSPPEAVSEPAARPLSSATNVGVSALQERTEPPLSTRSPDAGEGSAPTRRGKTSHRGKKSVLFGWPASEVRLITQAAKRQRRAYKDAMRQADPDGTFNLTISNVTATALSRALDHPQDWADADHVRNDARRAPQADREPLEDIGLTWPVALIERLTDAWEDLDAEGEWPARFTLTKANLALAGIRFEMQRLDDWLIEVPNDDRFTTPTDTDGRRRSTA